MMGSTKKLKNKEKDERKENAERRSDMTREPGFLN